MEGSRLPPFPLLQSSFNEIAGSLSPDGRLSYASNETGEGQVYVQPFENLAARRSERAESFGKRIISAAGGYHPHWRPDGRDLILSGS
jgi:hypothetical protein